MCTVFIATIYTITYDYSRSEWFWRTSELPYVLIGGLIVLVIIACPYEWLSQLIPVRLLPRITFLLSSAFSILWVFAADALQEWDQGDVLNAARVKTQFADTDLTQYSPGGYMERFPYQAPLVVLVRALIVLSGSRADYVFCLLNAIAVAITMMVIVKLSIVVDSDNAGSVPYIAMILSLTFLPAYFYAVTVYGNTLSVMFIAMGFYAQVRCMQSSQGRKSIIVGMTSAVCIAMAIVIKSSSIVALIASVLVWLVWALWKRSWVPVVFVLSTVILKTVLAAAPAAYLERLADVDLSRGAPHITWIAMGIGASQPEDQPIVQPWPGGLYDAYPWRIPDAQYSPEVYDSLSHELIAKRLERFRSHPGESVRFFVGKIAYEWGDPLYESLVSSNWTVGNVVTVEDGPIDGVSQAQRPLTPIARSMYYGKANFVVRWLCDVMQTVLFFGFFIGSTILCRRRHTERWLLLGVTALYAAGGGVLYLIWEARSQYTLGFAMMMIPIGAIGLSVVGSWIRCGARSLTTYLRNELSDRHMSAQLPRHRA